MQYRVALVQEVWEEATLFVDAKTPEEAEEIARKMAEAGDVKWNFMEAPNPIEIVAVEASGSIAALAQD